MPFIVSPPLDGPLLILKIIFIIVGLIFLGSIIFLLIKSSWLKYSILYDAAEILTYRPFGVKKIVKTWTKIMARLDTGLESEYKLAVIEADSILDDILKRMQYGGASLGERLEKITVATIPNIEAVWGAHKTRNNIVHDPDYKLSLDEAKKVLDVYVETFRNLDAF